MMENGHTETQHHKNQHARLQQTGESKYVIEKSRDTPEETSPNFKGIVDVSCKPPPAQDNKSMVLVRIYKFVDARIW